MLLILTFDEPLTLKLRLEGILDESTLTDFREAIFAAMAARGSRKLRVDVGDLTLKGPLAESAIMQFIGEGVTLVAAVGRLAELIQRHEKRECAAKCTLLQRLVFSLATACNSSPRPICNKLSRLLHN